MTPFFSVIVPTYNRRKHVERLLELLSRQRFTGFEVIVADQTSGAEIIPPDRYEFHLRYLILDTPGATRARNVAIREASGQVVAFTDDDCEPEFEWLANAEPYFKDKEVAGLEGRIESGKPGPDCPYLVSNFGLEGLGFLTANLFIRNELFRELGGFDERFDSPHFREDTDLGWRALQLGALPFAKEVRVFHPAVERPGVGVLKRFVQDALLCHKDPARFLRLAKAEGHFRRPGYWQAFTEGVVRHQVSVPLEDLRPLMGPGRYELLKELSLTLKLNS